MAKKESEEMENTKKKLKETMLDGIYDYVTKGTLPHNNPNSYMDAYTEVQTSADKGDTQSESLFKFHNEIILKFVDKCLSDLQSQSTSHLIDEFIKKTENINFLVYWLNRIFTYLDRFYTKAKGKKTLCKNALDIYREKLFIPLEKNIFTQVNILIKLDRNGQTELRPKIKTVLKIIDDVDLYSPRIIKENNKISWISEPGTEQKNGKDHSNKWYTNTFERETKQFASDKARNDIRNLSAPEYIVSSLKYLEEEKTRQREYINKAYHNKINDINYSYFVKENAAELAKMDTGIPYMFKNKRLEELKKAYTLLSNYSDSLKVIMESFDPYIRSRGTEIYENKEIMRDPKKFIPELIKLKHEMDKIVTDCFDENSQFQDTKNKAFTKFMSKEHYAKQLSNYTDYCMKNGFKGKSDDEIDKELNDITGIFKCISNKLVFQTEINKKMSDRLIQGRSLSLNAEKSLITKLKQEAGTTYVNNMTEMMKDLEKNKTETESYVSQTRNRGRPNGIKMNIQVISQSAWEINKKSMEMIELPFLLKSCIKDFEDYYLKKYNGQKLCWCLGLSKIEIKYLTLPKQYISISTLVQFLTLLLLEKHKKLSLGKIASFLGCSTGTVINDVPGLVYNPTFNRKGEKNKGLILGNFNGETKEFTEETEIEFNEKFVNNNIKFNTLPLVLKKSVAEMKETELEEAQINRRFQENILQATITRIMKSRIGQKTTHVWLIGETSKQVDYFRAQPQQIKESIEKLIEKNVIKRSDNDRTCYDYIA